MPEARDPLGREENPIEVYSRRRRFSRPGGVDAGRVGPIFFALEDDHVDGSTAGTPFRWGGTSLVGSTPQPVRVAVGRSALGAPRIGRTPQVRGRENRTPLVGRARGRGRGNFLPSWYPRRPLHDITTVVRAVERRREHERQRDGEGQQTEGGRPTVQDQIIPNSPAHAGRAPLEHDVSMITPRPANLSKCCPPSIAKVQKILLDIAHDNGGESSSSLTPQKKLLNNIDIVEKAVMEELSRLKKTPSAKKAEREQKVRTLMSMR